MSKFDERPTCLICDTLLSGIIKNNWTACPNCGKRWELTNSHKAIRSVTLKVHGSVHKNKNKYSMEDQDNG